MVAVSLLASGSQARYLTTIGAAECCRSHCHRGHATTDADANRCCSVHLSVLPSALGPTAPDLHHALQPAAVMTVTLDTVAAAALARRVPSATIRLRGSPPGSLLAAHTALLI